MKMCGKLKLPAWHCSTRENRKKKERYARAMTSAHTRRDCVIYQSLSANNILPFSIMFLTENKQKNKQVLPARALLTSEPIIKRAFCPLSMSTFYWRCDYVCRYVCKSKHLYCRRKQKDIGLLKRN